VRLPTPWSADRGGPDGGAPAVELEDLTVDLGETRALEDVTVDIEGGQFVGLVGPNGAGKTTLLRTVTGAVAPTAGQVRVHGDEVGGLASRVASRLVAAVPQDPSVAFAFDVREVVAMGRTPYRSRLGGDSRADRVAVDRALERTDTARFADRPVDEVSGGERRRVLLARALTQDTPVLLLDEPTASLDVNHQINTLELVADLAGGGKTVVAAVHDLNLAARYCDRLLLLADGDLVAAGPPEAVLTEANAEAAFGTRAAVTRHPVTGSTFVAALPAATRDTDYTVHVVGGSGSTGRLLYDLATGFDVSVGALNRGDAALEAARALGVETVTVPPAAPVGAEAAATVRERVADADVTVVADLEVSEGNLPNLRAARVADAVAVVEGRPFEERNAVGTEARAVYEDLCQRGVVVDPDRVVEAVAELAAGSDGTDAARASDATPRPSFD